MIAPRHRPARGVTLIELLVSVALLAILCALLFPAIKIVTEQSQTTKCASNIRRTYSALIAFIMEHNGSMPPYREFGVDENGKQTRHETWGQRIKPYFDGKNPRCPTADKSLPAWYGLRSTISSDGARMDPIHGKPPEKFNQTANPSKRFLIADSAGEIRITAAAAATEWAFRHHGERANIIFFDGHIEARTIKELPLPANGISSSSPEYTAFWTKGQ